MLVGSDVTGHRKARVCRRRRTTNRRVLRECVQRSCRGSWVKEKTPFCEKFLWFLLVLNKLETTGGRPKRFWVNTEDPCLAMPLPSISGMDPPFGDAFENYSFTDQALTSTDLLASSSDPDFMYELDRDVSCRESPRAEILLAGDRKEMENIEHLTELLDSDPTYSSTFEQWDSYWEDLTKYTKLTSCDIWGSKEVDFLGLDDFSSPYQDEEVIGQTPTLAQLNSEDSQPVSDTLYHPDLLLSQKNHPHPPPSHSKKGSGRQPVPSCSSARSPLPDFAECAQKATWPIASTTETMSKAVGAKVRIGAQRRPTADLAPPPVNIATFVEGASVAKSAAVAPASSPAPSSAGPAPSCPLTQREAETPKLEPAPVPESVTAPAADPQLLPVAGGSQDSGGDPSRDKEEEHNYSLFVTQGKMDVSAEPDAEDEDGVELEDEDHDEGFGSEHELSENDEEEEGGGGGRGEGEGGGGGGGGG
ncbi:hypothetical protein SKAU_G00301080 [Synaphobranchus kaupii]|uniref:Uncharacterized protein n=1 Tax=Synaphobranchus kaupii TaxID=118154 RepID=A0A9Q1EVN7_SYNKA|nr:hypothetical protein SKAU_G00301080 [Synaphobranchus kaupii]